MIKITLKRKKAWADKIRSYKIWIDGVCVGKIREGGAWSKEVTEGAHKIQLSIDWYASPVLEFDSDADFECVTNVRGWKLMFPFVFLFDRGNWIHIEKS